MRVDQVCRQAVIKVEGLAGLADVKAWRHGDWAVHRQIAEPMLWCITFVPLGRTLPLVWASFDGCGRAVGAMVEIARLRNDWSRVTQADLTPVLGARLQEVCRRHGAVEGPVQVALDADVGLAGRAQPRLNGYALPR